MYSVGKTVVGGGMWIKRMVSRGGRETEAIRPLGGSTEAAPR